MYDISGYYIQQSRQLLLFYQHLVINLCLISKTFILYINEFIKNCFELLRNALKINGVRWC